MESEEQLKEFFNAMTEDFPSLEFCMAYGSAVKPQVGYTEEQKKAAMVDFVFGVKNADEWHASNIAANPSHYSSLKFLGSKVVSFLGSIGPGLYYNTLVPFKGKTIKYGVISEADLLKDLTTWSDLYIAGRMHKSVSILTSNAAINEAVLENRVSATRTALLLTEPETVSMDDFLETITQISYSGDVRMGVGENPNKASNIVEGQKEALTALYTPILVKMKGIDVNDDLITKRLSEPILFEHLLQLPQNLKFHLFQNEVESNDKCSPTDSVERVFRGIIRDKRLAAAITVALAAIVHKSSMAQSAKGVLTAGFSKSFRYALAKVKKRLV